MTKDQGNFGIIVSGGPAPGINSVICASVIEARNRGYTVKGLSNGFRSLCTEDSTQVVDLTIDAVSPLANTGGSLLGTSRFNPFAEESDAAKFISGLANHAIDKLIVIGGEGSAYLSYQLMIHCPSLRVVHVPKTIDNDLILPNHSPSFGFETAQYVGTKILDTLIVDAKTTQRWFLVTTMGRNAGFLALGLGLASGATLTIIPEEFPDGTTPDRVAAIIHTSIEKRNKVGKNFGVAVLAEGLLDRLKRESTPELKDLPRDSLGRIRLSDIELGDVIGPPLRALCRNAGNSTRISSKNIGYELRCHSPVSFDREYTKFLGLGAVRHILEGKTGIMVTKDNDRLGCVPLSDMIGPEGKIRSRSVDLDSDMYKVARSFMIR